MNYRFIFLSKNTSLSVIVFKRENNYLIIQKVLNRYFELYTILIIFDQVFHRALGSYFQYGKIFIENE